MDGIGAQVSRSCPWARSSTAWDDGTSFFGDAGGPFGGASHAECWVHPKCPANTSCHPPGDTNPCRHVPHVNNGQYCGKSNQTLSGWNPAAADPDTVYECFDNQVANETKCPSGCFVAAAGQPDACNSPKDACNTVAAVDDGIYCGRSPQNHFNKNGTADPDSVYDCRNGRAVSVAFCSSGCCISPGAPATPDGCEPTHLTSRRHRQRTSAAARRRPTRCLPFGGHLVPCSPLEDAPRALLVLAAPLLEKERHPRPPALVAEVDRPGSVHRPRLRARLTTHDRPVDAAQVEIRQRAEDRELGRRPVATEAMCLAVCLRSPPSCHCILLNGTPAHVRLLCCKAAGRDSERPARREHAGSRRTQAALRRRKTADRRRKAPAQSKRAALRSRRIASRRTRAALRRRKTADRRRKAPAQSKRAALHSMRMALRRMRAALPPMQAALRRTTTADRRTKGSSQSSRGDLLSRRVTLHSWRAALR